MSKEHEAIDEIKQAEKAMATSFFKRNPNYDEAAMHYENAGLFLHN
jgi:hypothetical protein